MLPQLSLVLRVSLLTTSAAMYASASAQGLPPLTEPQLKPLMAAVATELLQYAANPVAPMAPQTSMPWPCAIQPADLDVFAETVDSDDNPIRKAELLSDARAGGIAPIKVSYTDKVVTVVRATCEAGKLSGPVEFWMAYDMVITSSDMTSRTHQLMRIRAHAHRGKPVGIVLKTGSSVPRSTEYADPEMAKSMASVPENKTPTMLFLASMDPNPEPHSSVAVSRFVLNGQTSVSTRTRFTRPDGLVVEDLYGLRGTGSHEGRTLRRQGKKHGLEQIFGGTDGDVQTPPQSFCWQHGERILTLSCPSD